MRDDATNSKSLNTSNLSDLCGEIKTRWVRTSVYLFDHPTLNSGPFDRRSAFLWLVSNAAWRPRRVSHKGRPFTLSRGQLFAGRKFLAEKWGWSEKQVRVFLELLGIENMIERGQSGGHFANIITICNYDKYQLPETASGQSKGQSRASAGPEQGQTLTSSTNTTNTTKENLAAALFHGNASERAEIAKVDLKEVEALAVKLATLIDPDACDDDGARDAIERAIENHGIEKVRQGLADFQAKAKLMSFGTFDTFCANVSRIRTAPGKSVPTPEMAAVLEKHYADKLARERAEAAEFTAKLFGELH